MVCFQSSHIKLSFPVRVGDLNDFYIHSEKVCHIWNDCHPESFRNETCDYDVLVYFIRNLGLHLYFLKQIVNNTSQTGGLRKNKSGDKEPVPSDLLIRVRKADDFSERSQQDLV